MTESIFNNEDSGSQSVHFIRSFVSKLLPQKILLLLLIIFSSFSSYSIAGIQEKQDIPGMVQRSDLIIRGKVISTESQWKEDSRGRHIYTSVTAKILDKIKGNIKDDAFVFEVVGGTVDDIGEVVSDTPAFEVDEDAILFLAGDPLTIQHGINGKIPIYDGRVYLDGSEATADSFIQTLKILGQDPHAPTSLEGKYPAPTEGVEAAQCYIYNGHKWFGTSPVVCYYINENTSDCSGEGAAVQRGANTWNNAGADFAFQYCGSCSSTSEGMNGINCIMWGTTSGSLATAYRWFYGTGEIFECDIVVNDNYTWSTDPDAPSGEYDVESVALHELGHWLNLADLYDPADSDKVMYGFLSSGDEVRTLHSCDIDGICYIYGGCSCSITVTSPTGGSNWKTGTLHPIMWNSSNNPGSSVKIELYKGSSLIQTITSSTNDDGSYSWVIPTSLADDNDYRIKITATLDSSCYDYSSYFAIDTSCSIIVTSPNGDCWEVGQVYNINWISDITSGDVKIELYKGGSLDRVITPSTPDTGTYAWSVPVDGSLTGDCYYGIKVTDVLSSSCNDYSTYFCIATPPEAQDDNVTTSKGIPVMITLQTTDEGCPNPPAALTHIITSLPIHGNLNDPGAGLITDPCTSLVGYGNQVEYIPETGYEGQDSFTFIAYDGGVPPGGGDSNEAIITINVVACTTVSIGTDTIPWSYPMRTYYHDSRTQVIYLAGEIGIPGNIKDLALDVAIAPGQTMNNWTIRMKHTSLDNYSTPFSLDATGWTTVYDENESISSTGWRTFTFETPFAYNGSDNLLVDFSHNNSAYTTNGYCMVSTPGPPRSVNASSNSVYGDPLTWSGTTSPTVTGNSSVPNVQLTICGECSLGTPVLHPEPDTTLDTCNTIYWDPIPDANWYYAECANDANSYNIIANSGWIHDANYEFCSLELGQTYWYRVLAWTSFPIKDWLQTTQVDFETDTLTDTIATADGNVLLADAGTPTVDVMGDTTNSNSGIQRMRLVACECTNNRVLTEIEAYLNISVSTEVRFVVYESATQSGTYTKIHENTISTSGTGQRFYSSGPIAISLQAGKYYTMGSAWLGTAGYYSGVTPPTLAFGNVFGYAYQDSYPPPGTHGSPTSYTSYYYHRLTTTTQTGYVSSGTIVSTEINLPFDGNWEVVDFNTTTPADTDLTVDILPAAGSTPIPGYENVSNGANLSGISEPTVRLRANLSTTNTNNTPVLHNWSVTYTDPTFACESGWSNVESSLQCNTLCDFDNSNTINFADYAILTGQWRQAPGSPSADIAPEVPDGFVDYLDLSVFVEDWLLELTCTVEN